MNGTTPQLGRGTLTFAQLLSSTRRGARLARLLAVGQLRTWEVPPQTVERAEQIVAELAANAALHGNVRGRDFRLSLAFSDVTGVLRIEVVDTRGEDPPVLRPQPDPDGESGRGLFLVAALADRWGSEPYRPSGKSVWAEIGEPVCRCARDVGPSAVLPGCAGQDSGHHSPRCGTRRTGR